MYDFNGLNGFGTEVAITLDELRRLEPWRTYIQAMYISFQTDESIMEEYLRDHEIDFEDLVFLSPCQIIDLIEQSEYNHLTSQKLHEIQTIYDYADSKYSDSDDDHHQTRFDPSLNYNELELE
jgi:hypothetical protein